ncbi:hypothetical protein SUGI_0540830 [Cryptomeria japonica]|nr:hypothetical protein SUGI_0540830 [Cryptomeria japonica]
MRGTQNSAFIHSNTHPWIATVVKHTLSAPNDEAIPPKTTALACIDGESSIYLTRAIIRTIKIHSLSAVLKIISCVVAYAITLTTTTESLTRDVTPRSSPRTKSTTHTRL